MMRGVGWKWCRKRLKGLDSRLERVGILGAL
jgi:hypothetical protein